MKYKHIPHTDLYPSVICLGTVSFGTTLDTCIAFHLLDTFFEHGGNFIDTAHIYGGWASDGLGLSEKTIGQWVKERGVEENIIIATKGAHPLLSAMHLGEMYVLSSILGHSLRASRIASANGCRWESKQLQQKQDNRFFPAHIALRSRSLCCRVYPERKEGCQQFKAYTTQITSSFAFCAGLLHPRRQATLKGDHRMSTEDNKTFIRRYFEQIVNAEADFKRRLDELDKAAQRTDISAQPVAFGVIVVKGV